MIFNYKRKDYNCLHCFNAKDNAPLQSEWSYEEAKKLIEEASDCGINCFTLTGGEPMVHPHFLDIVKEIYSHGMYIFELNTNGYFITQEILDEFKKLNCRPLMKISFDGLGFHDWMRNRKGAEEETLKAIKLCNENHFNVMVQMQFNKRNKDVILKSLEYLDSIGVYKTRVIWTTPAPRWEMNAHGSTFNTEEYFDECLKLIEEYTAKKHKMHLVFWQFANVNVTSKGYDVIYTNCDEYKENAPLCKGNRGMIAVSSNGDVFPCLQMSGFFEARNEAWGNLKKESLESLLQTGKYMKEVTASIKDLIEVNEKCRDCKWLRYCLCGCRALAILYSGGNLRAEDKTKCIYFNEGYFDKIKTLAESRKNKFIEEN